MGEGSSSSGDKNRSETFRSLLMVHTEIEMPKLLIWLLDSGFSSHMMGERNCSTSWMRLKSM